MAVPNSYHYESSIKSRQSDELINTYLIRPAAGKIVQLLYNTSMTPNQMTIAAIIVGLTAAGCFGFRTYPGIILAGILIEAKDILDSADGQLARAKQMYSRRGRFLDSLGDVFVNTALFAGIIVYLHAEFPIIILAFAGFTGTTLRVSYHVFYHVKYLHLTDLYGINRTEETITESDRAADSIALLLQKVYLFIYGWQDHLMACIDQWCLGQKNTTAGLSNENLLTRWYGDPKALRLSGFIGLGTELALLACCSFADTLQLYLWLNLTVMNGIFIVSVLYRKIILSRHLAA
jgi:archaetidylinositol phosphate synthase